MFYFIFISFLNHLVLLGNFWFVIVIFKELYRNKDICIKDNQNILTEPDEIEIIFRKTFSDNTLYDTEFF